MTRPLRIVRAGGWHHVFARGVNLQAIRRDDRDREHFLEGVDYAAVSIAIQRQEQRADRHGTRRPGAGSGRIVEC